MVLNKSQLMKTIRILKGKDCPQNPQQGQPSQLKKTLRDLKGKK